MIKKFLTTGIVVMLAAFLLAACGNTNDKEEGSTENGSKKFKQSQHFQLSMIS